MHTAVRRRDGRRARSCMSGPSMEAAFTKRVDVPFTRVRRRWQQSDRAQTLFSEHLLYLFKAVFFQEEFLTNCLGKLDSTSHCAFLKAC